MAIAGAFLFARKHFRIEGELVDQDERIALERIIQQAPVTGQAENFLEFGIQFDQ